MWVIFISSFYLPIKTACDTNSLLCNSDSIDTFHTPGSVNMDECVEKTISKVTKYTKQKLESKETVKKVDFSRRVVSFFRRFLRRSPRSTEKQEVSTKPQKLIKRNCEQEDLKLFIETSRASVTGERPLKSVQQWSPSQRKPIIPLESINGKQKTLRKKQNLRKPTLKLTENTKRIVWGQISESNQEE